MYMVGTMLSLKFIFFITLFCHETFCEDINGMNSEAIFTKKMSSSAQQGNQTTVEETSNLNIANETIMIHAKYDNSLFNESNPNSPFIQQNHPNQPRMKESLNLNATNETNMVNTNDIVAMPLIIRRKRYGPYDVLYIIIGALGFVLLSLCANYCCDCLKKKETIEIDPETKRNILLYLAIHSLRRDRMQNQSGEPLIHPPSV